MQSTAKQKTEYRGLVRLLKLVTPDRFDPQPVSESGQAATRCLGAFIFLLLLGALHLAGLGSQIAPVWTVALLYQVFAYLWIWVISLNLLPLKMRKWMTIVLDFSIFSFGFATGGEAIALMFFTPVFSAIGYALRYGIDYARLALLIGTPLLGLGMLLNPFWLAHPYLSAGVLICFLTLPIYVKKLSEQVIISKLQLEEHAKQLRAESRRDTLTGLLNRIGFREQIATQLDDTQPSSILYIDLDGFKTVNDTAGHLQGDRVLVEVAAALAASLRAGDVVARLGGDEFAVSVRHLRGKEDARQIAENILQAISKIRIEKYQELRVGASIGIFDLPSAEICDIDTLLEHADDLMYRAKQGGKNRWAAN